MRMGPIILFLGTIAVVGWIAPGLKAGGQGGAQNAASARQEHEGAYQREAWLTGSTVLDREPDGHFYADATIASHRAHFLVDTGASIVALTASDAEAIGLDWREDDLKPIGRGASGTVYGVPVRLDRVELGGFEATDVDAAIIPQGLDVSLLGQSFLSRLSGVRIDGDRMILGAGS
ncbi:MAG TPA: TIGR02281 family clan AA aspartic protease [Novosphingobium sp.]|nr:TIGR02281 family clan AA aspartic protease [Novosphingobium sp.]